MTAREYLSQAWEIRLRIESMTEMLEFLKSAAEHLPAQFSDARKLAARNIRRNENAIVRMMDFENRVQSEREKLNAVMTVIADIADPTAQAVIVKRYIERKTWHTIASETFYSEKTVRNIHAAALDEIDKALERLP